MGKACWYSHINFSHCITISLLASAGHGNIAKNTTMNGGNITVNVAGSVVSQGDLVNGIKNGLATLMRRRGGSQFAVL